MKKKLKQNKLWVGMLIAVFVLGGLAFVGVQTKAQIGGFSLDRLLDMWDRNIELERKDAVEEIFVAEQGLGAISSPDIPSPYLQFGGITRWQFKSTTLIQGSSTVCAILAPLATSTLISASIHFETASSGVATILSIARSTTPNSTTTQIGTDMAIGTGGHITVQASTTPLTNAELAVLLFPRASIVSATTSERTQQFLVFDLRGGEGVGQFTPSGSCQATFEEL